MCDSQRPPLAPRSEQETVSRAAGPTRGKVSTVTLGSTTSVASAAKKAPAVSLDDLFGDVSTPVSPHILPAATEQQPPAASGPHRAAAAHSLEPAAHQQPAPSNCSPEFGCAINQLASTIEMLLAEKPPRLHEAYFLLRQVTITETSHLEQAKMNAARTLDDELEEAIVHRNRMRECQAAAQRRLSLCHFVANYREVRHCPYLRASHMSKAANASCEKLIQWIQKSGGCGSIVSSSSSCGEFEKLLLAAAQAQEADTFRTAESVSEALLLAALTDLCRSVMQIACGEVSSAAVSHRPKPIPSTPSSSSSFYTMQLSANVALLRQNSQGLRHLKWLCNTLRIARCTVFHKVPEAVQATVSLLVAELLSLFDRILPPSIPLAPLEKKLPPNVAACRLSGLRVDDDEGSSGDKQKPSNCPPDINPGVWLYACRIGLTGIEG